MSIDPVFRIPLSLLDSPEISDNDSFFHYYLDNRELLFGWLSKRDVPDRSVMKDAFFDRMKEEEVKKNGEHTERIKKVLGKFVKENIALRAENPKEFTNNKNKLMLETEDTCMHDEIVEAIGPGWYFEYEPLKINETTFVKDRWLKRWIRKNASTEEEAAMVRQQIEEANDFTLLHEYIVNQKDSSRTPLGQFCAKANVKIIALSKEIL